MKAKEFLRERYENEKSREQEYHLNDMYKFGKEAVDMAIEETKAKALKAFCEANCGDFTCYARYTEIQEKGGCKPCREFWKKMNEDERR